MPLSDDDVATIVLREIRQAQGYDNDTLAAIRQGALDFYYGKLPPEPVEGSGRASIVSMDVADGLHALLAQLSPVIRSSMIEFPPNGQTDVAAAEMEGAAVRRAIERQRGYMAIGSALFDALLQANCWVYVDIEEEERTEAKEYPPETPAEAFAADDDEDEGVTVDYAENGNLRVTRRSTVSRLVFEAVPPEEMLYSNEPGIGCGDIDKLRFVARKRKYTQAALVKMGIAWEDIEQIPDAVPDNDQGEVAREGAYIDGAFRSVQEANRLKDVYCCYVRLDMADGAKETELRHVWVGGTKVLLDEPADFCKFVSGSAIPVPHRVQGIGIAELLASIQQGKTDMLRKYLDALEQQLQGRVGVLDGAVTMPDLLNGRVSGAVRCTVPNAVWPLNVPATGDAALQGMNYMDTVRTQRVGAALDATEMQSQIMSASATAAAGQLAKVEMMAGWFADNLAETLLIPVYLLAHRLLRTVNQPIMVKRQGQWQEVNPSQWPARDVAEVTMGLTTAQRIQRIQALSQTLGQLQQLVAAGQNGVMTDASRIYNCMADWLRANDIPDADKYLIDPSSPQAQAAAQQNAQAQQQGMAQTVLVQQRMMTMQHEFELVKQERELDYKRWSDALNAELKEAQITADGITKAVQARVQAAADRAAQLSKIMEGASDGDTTGQGGGDTGAGEGNALDGSGGSAGAAGATNSAGSQ